MNERVVNMVKTSVNALFCIVAMWLWVFVLMRQTPVKRLYAKCNVQPPDNPVTTPGQPGTPDF